MDLFTNKAQFDTGFSEIPKLKDDSVPSLTILDLITHTQVSKCFYYVVTIACLFITDRLTCTEYAFLT